MPVNGRTVVTGTRVGELEVPQEGKLSIIKISLSFSLAPFSLNSLFWVQSGNIHSIPGQISVIITEDFFSTKG